MDLHTIDLVKSSLFQAHKAANKLNVPLIISGDLHNTKANMRAECMNALITEFDYCNYRFPGVKVYLLIGNHDLINEKSQEHALNFLSEFCRIIDYVTYIKELDMYAIPYTSNTELLKKTLGEIPTGSTIIMHQGVQGAKMGDYVLDKTSLPKEFYARHRIISGHYHPRQDIKCGENTFSYVGNPYTVSFGEANDPEKGFQIINSDRSLTFIPTNLRKHVIIEIKEGHTESSIGHNVPNKNDLVWVKVYDTKEVLLKITRQALQKRLGLSEDFKLDLIPLAETRQAQKNTIISAETLLDEMIDAADYSEEQKVRLKELWRKCCVY